MSDRLSVGTYTIEITDQQVVIRDQTGAIIDAVDLASLDGALTLPDGRSVDMAALLADAGADLSEFKTAAGPAGNGDFGPAGGDAPGTFRAFNGEAGGMGFRAAAGTLAGTTLKHGQIEDKSKKDEEDETELQSSLPVTWSSHDQWQIPENQEGGALGKLVDGNPADFTFKVSDPRFEVVNGVLRLRNGFSFDYETEAFVDLEVTAASRTGDTQSRTFRIDVLDQNEAPTDLSLDGATVVENTAGAIIGNLTVIDPDAGDSQSFQVSDSRFEVVNGQLKLKDGISLDFEAEPSVDVVVTATDKGGNQIQETFTIAVGDVNEAQTSLSLDTNTVAENAAGAVIGSLTAADPDVGDSQSFQVSDNRFEVVNGQLKLKDGVSLDFESEATVGVTITTTDKGGNQFQETFSIGVRDVNEAQTSLSLDGSKVAENTAGVVIGTLSVVDPDAGDNQSFQVSDSRFEIVNGQLKLKDGISLDFETEPGVNVTVTATDKGGHTIARQFAIDVSNVNEAPTSIALNTNGGATLINGSFEANKLNNGHWKLFNAIDGWNTTTKIEVQNNVTNKASHGSQVVEMDADKGVDTIYQDVKTVAGHVYDLSFDTATRRDTKRTDTVEVYWNGVKVGTIEPGSTTWQTNTFQVVGTGGSDRLEFREQSGDNDTYGGLLDNVALKEHPNTIAENAKGAVVGTLSVIDPDVGDTHTYGVSDSRFEVVNGVLKLKDGVSLDYESGHSVDLTVTATDSAGNSAQQMFTIGVADVAESGSGGVGTPSVPGGDYWTSELGKGQTTLGAGDDDLFIDTSSISPVRMGDGYDTVHLAQQNRSFDHKDAVKLDGVEAIDTTGYGVNNVALSINDVLNMTDADNHLTVVGDKGDVVTLSGNGSGHWSVAGTSGEFTTYVWSDPVHQAVVEISNQLTAQIT